MWPEPNLSHRALAPPSGVCAAALVYGDVFPGGVSRGPVPGLGSWQGIQIVGPSRGSSISRRQGRGRGEAPLRQAPDRSEGSAAEGERHDS